MPEYTTSHPSWIAARKRLDQPGYVPNSEDLEILFNVHRNTVLGWAKNGEMGAVQAFPGSPWAFSRTFVRRDLGLSLMPNEEK